ADARALLARDNQPAENAIRVNTLVAHPTEVARKLNARSADEVTAEGGGSSESGGLRPAERLPEGLVLAGALDVGATPQFAAGAITPQSRASMLVSRIVAPAPGERVLDLCSAPGAKATHLAALMEDRGSVVAVERSPDRARELRETVRRMRTTCVEVVVGDARDDHGGGY